MSTSPQTINVADGPLSSSLLAQLEQAATQTAAGRACFGELRELHTAIARALDGARAAQRAGEIHTLRARLDLLEGLIARAMSTRARAGTAFARADSSTRSAAEWLRAREVQTSARAAEPPR
jgi:hypothetical protein